MWLGWDSPQCVCLQVLLLLLFKWDAEVWYYFLFYSPSEIYLHSLQEIAVYLQTEGTCKCGLECPLMLNKVFNFNPMATTKCWNVSDLSWNDPTKLCNHKRKIVAMATFRNSTIPLSSLGSVNALMTPSTSKKGMRYFNPLFSICLYLMCMMLGLIY